MDNGAACLSCSSYKLLGIIEHVCLLHARFDSAMQLSSFCRKLVLELRKQSVCLIFSYVIGHALHFKAINSLPL